uniref:Uncharacterized protein n=1 Tax=Panagrolaimus superbus TaxID=310955 RepID=A0A914Y6E7_9BILA
MAMARMKYFLTVPLQKGVDFYNMQQLLNQLQNGKWTVYEADNGYTLRKYCRQEQCTQVEELIRKGKIVHLKNLSSLSDETLASPFAVTLAALNVETVPNPVSIYDRKEKLLYIHDTTISVDMVAYVINK